MQIDQATKMTYKAPARPPAAAGQSTVNSDQFVQMGENPMAQMADLRELALQNGAYGSNSTHGSSVERNAAAEDGMVACCEIGMAGAGGVADNFNSM